MNYYITVNIWNATSKEFKKVDRDIYHITDGEAGGGFETLLIDKPAVE